ncbi:hypothetical protein FA95DRAFT_1578040 [Auriscalpium vulgare]|uniref:Uncharacterized protein n=1 Tax=Auriscalpium vulgare TaxID=40419 RepID=A0ACB8R3N5_9AGAM|nr:hypothetical protein FA95DRAFT_1578040 [Auriscalpium vulgare]
MWATKEQCAFLRSQLPLYRDAQALGCLAIGDFWPELFLQWLIQWPETEYHLTAASPKGEPTLQKRLKQWFNNHSRGAVGGNGAGKRRRVLNLSGKAARKKPAHQIYQQIFWQMCLKAVVEDAWAAYVRELPEGEEKMAEVVFRNKKCRELFDAEDQDVKAVVNAAHCGKSLQDGAAGDGDGTDDPLPDYQVNIEMLPQTAALALAEIHDQTNWLATILIGGPSPEDGGFILYALHMRLDDGRTFATMYPDFKDNVEQPFKIFLRAAFASSTKTDSSGCTSAALNPGSSGTSSSPASGNTTQELSDVDTTRASSGVASARGEGTVAMDIPSPANTHVRSNSAEPTVPPKKAQKCAKSTDVTSDADDGEIENFEVDEPDTEVAPALPLIRHGITQYKQDRLDNIARNKALLKDLGLDVPFFSEADKKNAEKETQRAKLAALANVPPRHSERIRSLSSNEKGIHDKDEQESGGDRSANADDLPRSSIHIATSPSPSTPAPSTDTASDQVRLPSTQHLSSPLATDTTNNGPTKSAGSHQMTSTTMLTPRASEPLSDQVNIPATRTRSKAQSKTGVGREVKAEWPKWLMSDHGHLANVIDDETWRMLVWTWAAIEEKLGYLSGKGLGQTISARRDKSPCTSLPLAHPTRHHIDNVEEFAASLARQRMALDATWVDCMKGGRSGFVIVLITLSWWFGVVETNQEKREWESALEDTVWVSEQMLARAQSTGGKHGVEEDTQVVVDSVSPRRSVQQCGSLNFRKVVFNTPSYVFNTRRIALTP